jgi:hypothetical protein
MRRESMERYRFPGGAAWSSERKHPGVGTAI